MNLGRIEIRHINPVMVKELPKSCEDCEYLLRWRLGKFPFRIAVIKWKCRQTGNTWYHDPHGREENCPLRNVSE